MQEFHDREMRMAEARHKADNFRAGLVAATLINLKLKKGAKQVRPMDFFQEPKPVQSIEDMMAALDRLADMQNAKPN